MKRTLAFVFAAMFSTQAVAEDVEIVPLNADVALSETVFVPSDTADLNQFIWEKRPVVVFADSPADPRYAEQMGFLLEGLKDLAERDVVVLTDTDPSLRSDLRLKLRPRGFMLVIIGKDGGVKLRKPLPWDVREISRTIDKMPMRKREIRAQTERITDG